MYSRNIAYRRLLQIALSCTLFLLSVSAIFADDYQKAWEALARNDRQTARLLLEKSLKDPSRAADAALTLLLLDTFDGHEIQSADLWKKATKNLDDPYPHLFALWFNSAVAGSYGRKTAAQEKLLEELLKDRRCPGTLKSAAQYNLAHHYLSQGKFKEMLAAWASLSNISEWQFVGPFDNLSGSGFDKNYPPIAQPEPTARFKSVYNSDVQWFHPSVANEQGYITPGFFIREQTAVVFAQSFVQAPTDMEAILALGFTGSIRVWVNDRLLISEEEFRRTDLDLYQVKCRLRKGANRVLVQIGFEDESYPNFAVRFLDDQSNLITSLSSSASYAPYPKEEPAKERPTLIPFFAESYFEQKIRTEPDNLLNYILLCKTYQRSHKSQEALAIIQKALQKSPENNLLHLEYIQVLIDTENRTEMTQELQRFKDTDPESVTSLLIRYQEAFDNEQYNEAENILNNCAEKYGEDEDVMEKRIKLVASQQRLDELIQLIQQANQDYPNNPFFNEMAHNIEIHLRKNPKAAVELNERFIKKNFVIPTVNQLIDEYFELGENEKAIKLLVQLNETFPSAVEYPEELFRYYYGTKDEQKALKYIGMLLQMAPYHSSYHANAAYLQEQSGHTEAALQAFQKALHYDPNNFDIRRRIRQLQRQTDLTSLLPQFDPYELIKTSKDPEKTGEFNWYYILDEEATILYPERCSETYYSIIIKVLNENGIDTWKETSLGYNPWRQRLLVEKAEVVKPNGSKISAEQNDNQLVFTNLTKGDAVYIRYRVVSYAYGRMAREYWNSYSFNAFVPSLTSRYALLAPKDLQLDFKTINTDQMPVVRDAEDFKLYTWEANNEPALKHENLMPTLGDAGKGIYVSTIPNWQDIALWYADLSETQAKQDFEVQQAVQALFSPNQSYTPLQKAQAIYTFIVKNISYSSVPFRQSAYVPQKASKVLQTKLGDCKDLATLYAAMAREAGLEANLVLLCTRDNGEQALPLPAVDFNHCIVKVKAGDATWYLELTDANLPFGCLPGADVMGWALEIPYRGAGAISGLYQLAPKNRPMEYRHLQMQIDIKNRDLNIATHYTIGGALTRNQRRDYGALNREKQIEAVQKQLSPRFNNSVLVKDVAFGALDQLNDTIQAHYQYDVRNYVIEIGELRTLPVPFYYVFVKSDAFSEEPRNTPVNYWKYEDADEYKEEINIQAPAGTQFTEIPKAVNYQFGKTNYQLSYTLKAPNLLLVTRYISIDRSDIPAADYPAFRKFVEDVVAAENRYVAYK